MQQPNNNKLSVLVEPTLAEAKMLIEKAFVQRRTLIVAGNCKVDYVGRASSKLELGERLLIIKADGSLLVHRPTGYEPVNWQPSGSIFHAQLKDDPARGSCGSPKTQRKRESSIHKNLHDIIYQSS